MATTIHPETLRKLRQQRKLSQHDLAERSSCSVAQISRWERGKSSNAHRSSMLRLAKALGVKEDVLIQPPASDAKDSADAFYDSDGVQLNVRVRRDTRTAMEVVGGLFGVTWSEIIELAPLVFLATAKGSLEERKAAVESIEQERDRVLADIVRAAPHLAPDFHVETYLAEAAIAVEKKSIESRDVFGPDLSFREYDVEEDPEEAPYVIFLRKLLGDWNEKIFVIHPGGYGYAPSYSVTEEFLKETYGVTGDSEVNKRILHYLVCGEIDLRSLRAKKDALSESEFSTWLEDTCENTRQVLEKRLEKRSERYKELIASFFNQ